MSTGRIRQMSLTMALRLLFLSVFVQSSAGLVQPLIPYASQQYFVLENKVTVQELKSGRGSEEASYTFNSLLKVNSVWNSERDQLLQVFFTESLVRAAAAKGKAEQIRPITTIPDRPFYISLVNGQLSKVIAHTSRDQSLLNVERGVASLLQVRFEDGPVAEVDVSGRCHAFYSVKSSTRIEKTKTACSHWDLHVNYRPEKPLGVFQHSMEQVEYELSANGELLRARSLENHRVGLQANPEVGSQVQSLLILEHTASEAEEVGQLEHATLDEAIESLLEWYRVFDIEADVDGVLSEIKDVTLKDEIAAYAKELTDEQIGRESLALVFAKLLPLARITKQDEFEQLLRDRQLISAQLVDLLGAVQTIDAHNAVHQTFRYGDPAHADLLEKYLQSLAVGTHPDRAIIKDLFGRLQDSADPIRNEKLHDSVLQTVASLTRVSGFDPNDSLLQGVRSYILTQLQAGCEKDVACQIRYVRALQNLQDVSTVPTLLEYALGGEVKLSVAAMQALKAFPVASFNESNRQAFADIFYEVKRKYDTSARTMALDILLAMKPTKEQLGTVLDYLVSADGNFEIKTYVIQKVRMLAEKCPKFGALLNSCLAERPRVNNYHVLAQKGLTTVLSRELSRSPAFNESLLSTQEISQGVLKRGSVELIMSAGRDETSTFKLGLYTSGLSSFVSDSEESDGEEGDDSPATAGMEIAVQNVLLRPLVFFTGHSELMGHIWSGTASEPTPAFQATTLAQDHEQYVILSSGATVYVRVVGMKSVDLNGRVELSIWNRNANTEIKQNSGAAVHGLTVAGFTYGRVSNEFELTYEPKINLQADIDFYAGVKLCLQLQRPEMSLTHSNVKSVLLNTPNRYEKLVRSKYRHKFPGSTLALNRKNNEMCNMILD